jgi:predicted homoserine dehydrogenase-like protein
MNVATAREEREAAGRPIGVGMVGAGATGRAIAMQLGTPVPGMRFVALSDRTLSDGERAYREAGVTEWSHIDSPREAEAEINGGQVVLTEDSLVLTGCGRWAPGAARRA